jgi:hypothetical protein
MSVVLVPPLRLALAQYTAARERGADIGPALRAFIAATAEQPPASIASAEGPIAAGAKMWSRSVELSVFRRRVLGHKEDLAVLESLPDAAYLFLFHRNGYLRQASLERLACPVPTPFLAATLAWRRNDWVRQVRQSAEAAMARCFLLTGPEVLAPFYLESIRVRSTWQRWNDQGMLALDTHAGRPDVAARIARLLAERISGPLPTSARKLTRHAAFDPFLGMLAREARVPGVRAVAIEAPAKGFAEWEDGFETFWINKPEGISGRRPRMSRRALAVANDRNAALRLGLADRSAEVRRSALRAIIADGLGDAGLAELTRPLLQDRSPSVRAKAAFIIEQAAAVSAG